MNKLLVEKSGRVYFPVAIKKHNAVDMEIVDFKIDTGADYSTISKTILYKLGYDDNWIKNNLKQYDSVTSTADGEEVAAYYIQLPLINIMGFEAKKLDI